MKIMLNLLALSAILAFSTSAFAGGTAIDSSYAKTIGGGSFKTSAKVTILVTATSDAYCAVSKHQQGTVEYGTLSNDPAIKINEICRYAIVTIQRTDFGSRFSSCRERGRIAFHQLLCDELRTSRRFLHHHDPVLVNQWIDGNHKIQD